MIDVKIWLNFYLTVQNIARWIILAMKALRPETNLKHTCGLNLSPKDEDFVLDKLAFLVLMSEPKTL